MKPKTRKLFSLMTGPAKLVRSKILNIQLSLFEFLRQCCLKLTKTLNKISEVVLQFLLVIII